MDSATVVLLGGIISCIIGIATFVAGMNSRAKKDGMLEQKINQAVEGIEEIKKELKSSSKSQGDLALSMKSTEERLKAGFKRIELIEQRMDSENQTRDVLINILKVMEKGNN